MTSLAIEEVHMVTINTMDYGSLRHIFIHRLYGYDKKTHLSIRIHFNENEKCIRQK